MTERLSESEEELRDSLADALESHVARHDEGQSDDRDRALEAADDVRPVVHTYVSMLLNDLAEGHLGTETGRVLHQIADYQRAKAEP